MFIKKSSFLSFIGRVRFKITGKTYLFYLIEDILLQNETSEFFRLKNRGTYIHFLF